MFIFLLDKNDVDKLEEEAGSEDFLELSAVVFQVEGGQLPAKWWENMLQLDNKLKKKNIRQYSLKHI